ncbi:MAG: efflux transporter outer membrane subunit [Pseudomonadota bacterium]
MRFAGSIFPNACSLWKRQLANASIGGIRFIYSLQLIGITTVLAGCSLTPSAETPQLVQGIEALPNYNGEIAGPASVAANDWWHRMGGEPLANLVDELIDSSLVLEEARLQVVQAQDRAAVAGGQRMPSLGYSVDRTRSRSPDIGGNFSWAENYSAGFNTNFDTDVWGRLRASERAALLGAQAAQLSYTANEQLEIARLIRNWIAAIALQNQLQLAQDTARTFETTYDLTDRRYRAGSQSSSASDVLIARQNLEFALIDIPELERQLDSQLLVIDEQLGRLPGQTAATLVTQSFPAVVMVPPLDKPIGLLTSRPDVAAAELRYRAALEDVGAAKANLYPAITLAGALTLQGETPSDFSWQDYIASLSSAISGPVFQGGRLRAQVRIEQAEADELATAFARAALAAVIDVETALLSIDRLTQQVERSRAAVATAESSNQLVQSRYRQGLSSLLAVLETQRSLNSTRQSLIQSEQALANAQVDLFVSLGGNWK